MSEEIKTDHHWKVLSSGFSGLRWEHVNMHQLNDKELLIVHHFNKDKWNLSKDVNIPNSLWKYNFFEDKWMKWYDYPKDMECTWSTSALNNDKTKLYMFGDPGYIITVDLTTGKFTTSHKIYHDGSHSKSLFYDGQFHIFGGWQGKDNSHFIWNEQRQDLLEIHKFDEITTYALNAFSLMYLSSQKSVLILHRHGGLFSYSLVTNKCNKMELNVKSSEFLLDLDEAVLTKDEQYVLMFMSKRDHIEITVLDLKSMKIGSAKTMPPANNAEFMMIREDKYKQEYVTFGYIRKENWNAPNDIIRMIVAFLCFEVIHVLNSTDMEQPGHWSIDVDTILSSTSFPDKEVLR